ncbi:hypothetical protein LTR66_016379, partial [Elasticomyces elasticus]
VKVIAPAASLGSSKQFPILLLSHGHGPSNFLSSLHGYGPVTTFFASHGFVVIQPTHLSSRTLKFPDDAPGAPLFWKSRPEDFKYILDHLNDIEAQFPLVSGRLDKSRVVVIGHSMGGHTASMLLGMTVADPETGFKDITNLKDERVKVGVLVGAPGVGGDTLSEMARKNYAFMSQPDFSDLTTPTLVIAGEEDIDPTGHLQIRGDNTWHTDPYTSSPGADTLVMVKGGKHGFGGISGFDAKEGDDSSPERMAGVLRMAWAYLWSRLYGGREWEKAKAEYSKIGSLGWVEEK